MTLSWMNFIMLAKFSHQSSNKIRYLQLHYEIIGVCQLLNFKFKIEMYIIIHDNFQKKIYSRWNIVELLPKEKKKNTL